METLQEDEIGRLATLYYVSRGAQAFEVVDRHIEFAQEKGQWTEVSKWHRVRLRIKRMAEARRQSREFVERLGELKLMSVSRAPVRSPEPSPT